MEQIEPDVLYDQRSEVSRARPLLQGDVFDGVILPGFGSEPRKVQIVAHPCAMRAGTVLAPRTTVAPVERYQQVTGRGWDGHLRVMPLTELLNGTHFATMFVDVTAAPTELLTRSRRIATLSHRGIYVLQQRLIKHYTRVEMPLEDLRRQSAPVLAEAELQWEWLEGVLSETELDDDEAIEAEVAAFDDWLGSGKGSRREQLRLEDHHAGLRREVHQAARDRRVSRASSRRAEADDVQDG